MKKNKHVFMPNKHMDNLYKSKNILINYFLNLRLNIINNFIPKNKKLKILDAGCGEGHLIKILCENNINNQYYGIDITKIALKDAIKRNPLATILYQDITDIKFNNDYFDFIICSDVIEHVIYYNDGLNELKRVVKNNGYIILCIPNEILLTIFRFFLGRNPIKVPDHVNSFTPYKLKKILNLEIKNKINLPFKILPFFLSMGSIIIFKNETKI